MSVESSTALFLLLTNLSQCWVVGCEAVHSAPAALPGEGPELRDCLIYILGSVPAGSIAQRLFD